MADRLANYLNPPKGQKFEWPTDIAEHDTAYLRRYIKWKYPEAFEPAYLPAATHKELVDYLTDKGYTFGAPYYVEGNDNGTKKRA